MLVGNKTQLCLSPKDGETYCFYPCRRARARAQYIYHIGFSLPIQSTLEADSSHLDSRVITPLGTLSGALWSQLINFSPNCEHFFAPGGKKIQKRRGTPAQIFV